MDRGMNLDAASRYLGISSHTLRAYAKRGKLPYFRLGRRLMFVEADLRAFLERHRVGGGPAPAEAGPNS